jgi:hypothetical protein
MPVEIYHFRPETKLAEVEVEVTTEVDAVDPIESEPTTEPSDTPEVSNQEKETAEAPAEVETPTATWTRTTDETDILAKIYNAEFDCARAEAIVEERKAELKEAKDHYDGCVEKLRELARHARNDSPEKRPLFANLDAKVEAVEEEGDSREEEPTAPTEPSWKSLTVDALPDITPKTKEQLRDGGINTLAELADLITRCEHDSTAAWPKGIGKVKQTAICDALITVQDLERCQGSEGVPVEAVYPTVEAWYAMSDEEQIAWLNERAVQLDSDNRESLICDPDHAYRESWVSGTEAAEAEEEIANCDVEPGPECDAWLLGWLWQSKQEDVEADDADETDAEE